MSISRNRRQDNKILRDFLRKLRVEAGYSQVELGKLLGRDQTFVSKYETGERRLGMLEIKDLCETLGLSLEQFCKRLCTMIKKGSTQNSDSCK